MFKDRTQSAKQTLRDWRKTPYAYYTTRKPVYTRRIIRHGTYHRFDAVFSEIDINPILRVVSKKSSYGSPVQLNYTAMVYSLVARITERIPTIKDLVKRLKNDFIFRLDCGFLLSDKVPSEASYSRMLAKITETNALEQVQEALLIQAISESFVTDDTIAIDATHIEARDRASVKGEETPVEPKKRGRKTKLEKEKWLQEQAEKESNLCTNMCP